MTDNGLLNAHLWYDHLLANGQLEGPRDGLALKSLDELRDDRSRCERAEAAVSFGRRLAQVRLDLLTSELERRQAGLPERPNEEIVADLARYLGEPRGNNRPLSFGTEPRADDVEQVQRLVESAAPLEAMATISELAGADVSRLAERLTNVERRLSSDRRGLHQVIDAVQRELAKRYGSGQIDVATLLARTS